MAFAIIMPGKGYAEECDFMAMLAKEGYFICDFNSIPGNFNDAEDFFEFLEYRSGPYYPDSLNDDGYGVVYYRNGINTIYYDMESPLDPDNQVFYLWGEYNHCWYQSHGPDGSDNYWNDSNHPAGPDYNWVDISSVGTLVTFVPNDQAVGPYDIGFDFYFYGETYSQFIINPNGWIGFGDDNTTWQNTSIPNPSAPRPAIFGFWDDLYPADATGGGGSVYYYSNGIDSLVVWFEDVIHYTYENSTYDFEMIFTSNGNIKFQYNYVSGTTNSATIGIQNEQGNDGLQVVENDNYVENDSYVENDLAVLFSTDVYPEPLDTAQARIIDDPTNEAVIVLGPDRNRSGVSENAAGQHPFRFEWNDRTYTLHYNGYHYLKETMEWYCSNNEPDWFVIHPLNWEVLGNNIGDLDTVCDTELLLHYIMKHVIENNGDVIGGIMNALNETDVNGYNFQEYFRDDWSSNTINFVLSDGEALYIFRNHEATTGTYRRISYRNFDNGFVAVKTQGVPTNWTPVDQYTLVYIPRNLDIITFDDIFSNYGVRYVSGTLENITTWSDDIYIIGDLELPGGATLEIETGANVYFTGRHNFTVNGEVTLNEGAGLHLSHHSAVTIDGANALLFIDWGSTITGANPKLRCECCPGDRIIAKNGGRITTRTKDDYNNYLGTPPSIEIYSRSTERWVGIQIENPDPNNPYWFVNCNISGISGISIRNTAECGRGFGNLNIYYTNYTNCNPIYVNNIERLTIIGFDNDNRCNFSNNQPQAVCATYSPVTIKYANIENNSSDGVYLAYVSGASSKIDSSYFTGNGRNGIYINDSYLEEFNQNHIENNGYHGVYSWYGTFQPIEKDTIRNNGGTEFIGHKCSYNMVDGVNEIDDNDGNSGGWDQYILAALDWQIGDDPIPVMGNTIPHGDETRFYPCFQAFDFGDDLSKIRQLFNSAFSDMKNQDYDNASITLNQLIDEYPESDEAVISVKCLYYIENYTDKNFTEFREFLDTIKAEYGTAMYKVKEDVKTKTYMADADYLTAIERLEEIINNPPTPDDSIYAIIDEAYCYLRIVEDSSLSVPARAMAINCSVKPNTLIEYREIVRELESGLSFFNDVDRVLKLPETEFSILYSNYPNPFNPITTIRFSLPSPCNIRLSIYNIKGQKIKTLKNEALDKGLYSVIWNGTDRNGKKVASGLYLYKLSAGNEMVVKKMLLIR